MKIISVTLFIALSSYLKESFAQDSSWVTISPANAYFTFKMPAQPAKYDTMNTKFYTYSVDSELVLQAYYFKPDSVFPAVPTDSAHDPLLLFAAQLIYSTSGTLTAISDIDFSGQKVRSSLKGKEVGTSYYATNDQENKVYVFTRIYYDGQSLLAFYISAPAPRIDDLLVYKNTFFQNITLLY